MVGAGSWRAGRGDHRLRGSRAVELVGLCAVSAAAHRRPQEPRWFSRIRPRPGVYEDEAGFEAQTLGRGCSGGGWFTLCCWGAGPRKAPARPLGFSCLFPTFLAG